MKLLVDAYKKGEDVKSIYEQWGKRPVPRYIQDKSGNWLLKDSIDFEEFKKYNIDTMVNYNSHHNNSAWNNDD